VSDVIRVIGDPPRKNNAELMRDCMALGYLDGRVLDVTYGQGRFWKLVVPPQLYRSDLDPAAECPLHWDFTDLPVADGWADTVVLDPPYKLNGKPSQGGPATSDASYGVGERRTPAERSALMYAGLQEAGRVASQFVLFKCQDQVVSGKRVWQAREFANWAESLMGMRLVDQLHVFGYREQPAGRRQVHAHQDYSTLLVLDASKAIGGGP